MGNLNDHYWPISTCRDRLKTANSDPPIPEEKSQVHIFNLKSVKRRAVFNRYSGQEYAHENHKFYFSLWIS
jgi:hypothetical protein